MSMPYFIIWPMNNFSLDSDKFLELARFFSSYEGTVFLYSGGTHACVDQSFLFLFPIEAFSYVSAPGLKSSSIEKQIEIGDKNPWDILKKDLGGLNEKKAYPKWVGYFGFEMGYFSDVPLSFPKSRFPLAFFQRCALTFRFDHKTKKCSIFFDIENRALLSEDNKAWFDLLCEEKKILSWLDSITPAKDSLSFFLESKRETKQAYIKKIKSIQDQIKKGEVYQVCISHEITFLGDGDPFNLFLQLTKDNPSPFSAYLNFKDYQVISISPERFVQKNGDVLETRPIKGTAPRGDTEKQDIQNKQHLLSSEKERAELAMITDLLRNDLGKVSQINSVQVTKSFEIESYSNVFQMYSVIKSIAEKRFFPVDIIRHMFPGGSISGCPKLSSLHMIPELEKRPRGIYTGSIGYFSSSGDFDFNIAIRTMISQNKKLTLALGSGIVIDSDPENEYEETLHKGKNFFQLLNNS